MWARTHINTIQLKPIQPLTDIGFIKSFLVLRGDKLYKRLRESLAYFETGDAWDAKIVSLVRLYYTLGLSS